MKPLYLILLLACAWPGFAQSSGNVTMVIFPGTPTGSCNSRQLALNQSNGALYTCNNGTWQIVSGGGGPALAGCSTPSNGNLVCTSSITGGNGNEGLLSLPYSTLPTPSTTALGQVASDGSGVPYYSPGTSTPFAKLMVGNPTTGLLSSSSLDLSTNPGGLGAAFVTRIELPNCNALGWETSTNSAECADLQSNIQTGTSYTIAVTDENRVIVHNSSSTVTDTLPAPSGQFAPPFVVWIDSHCSANVIVNASSGSLINGLVSLSIPACGWSMIWADQNQIDWHAQSYLPPGGVFFVQ